MKHPIFTIAAVTLLISSCSSAFKTAETPDDVYYSYGPKPAAVVEKNQEDEMYTSYWDNADDSYLRMKVQNRDRWNEIDDINYWYGYNNPANMWNNNINNPFYFNSFSWNTWYNPFAFNSYYNNWNNPYCWGRPVVIVNKFPAGTTAGVIRPGFNKGGFSNSVFDRNNNMGTMFNKTTGQQQSGYGNRELFRTIFGSSSTGVNGNSNSNSSWARPSRLFESSGSSINSSSSGSSRSSGSSSSSSSSSSSGGSSGGSRGGRGGN